MEKQSGKEGENSEKETFLDIQTYTFNKSVHLTFKKTWVFLFYILDPQLPEIFLLHIRRLISDKKCVLVLEVKFPCKTFGS